MAVYVLSKNEKIIYTSVNPSFTIYKMGFKGYKFHGRVTVILFGCGSLVPSCFMHEALRTGLVSHYPYVLYVGQQLLCKRVQIYFQVITG